MKSTSTIALAVTVGVSLSGCQALFGSRTAHVDSASEARVAGAEATVNPALEQGRQLLQAGRIAQAVELLRVAQRDPESMAEASNALGVAYAKLGRHDLADRYFRMALALRPEEARFAANMVRLQRDHSMMLRRNEEAALLAQRAEADRQAALARRVEPGRIERVSRGQVQINTQAMPQGIAPKMEVLAMHTAKKPEAVRVAEKEAAALPADEAAEAAEAKSYPLTIDFARKPGGQPPAPAQRQYPVRVRIGA